MVFLHQSLTSTHIALRWSAGRNNYRFYLHAAPLVRGEVVVRGFLQVPNGGGQGMTMARDLLTRRIFYFFLDSEHINQWC